MRISDWSSDVCSSDLSEVETQPSRSLTATRTSKRKAALPPVQESDNDEQEEYQVKANVKNTKLKRNQSPQRVPIEAADDAAEDESEYDDSEVEAQPPRNRAATRASKRKGEIGRAHHGTP